VWTATGSDGLLDIGAAPLTSGTCGDWATDASMTQGNIGDTDSTDGRWTQIDIQLCGAGARLYCFESP
jgi:hypothetical protein